MAYETMLCCILSRVLSGHMAAPSSLEHTTITFPEVSKLWERLRMIGRQGLVQSIWRELISYLLGIIPGPNGVVLA